MKNILIIGSAGFLGKVLLYYLNSLDDYHVYCLIRDKRNKTAQQRFNQIISTMLLSTNKFELIKGDVSALTTFNYPIDIVINSMAAIEFDLPFEEALQSNYINNKIVFEFCIRMNVKQFLHVSTAYTCDYRTDNLTEVIPTYPEFDGLTSTEIISKIRSKQFDIYSVFPNTYVITKLLFELFVDENKLKVPFNIQIVRPSICVASLLHPYPGYCDAYAAYMGYNALCLKGMIKYIITNNSNINLIPIDLVCEVIIETMIENKNFIIRFAVNSDPISIITPVNLFNENPLNRKHQLVVLTRKTIRSKTYDKLCIECPLKLYTSFTYFKGKSAHEKQKRMQNVIMKWETIFNHFVNTTYDFKPTKNIIYDNIHMLKLCDSSTRNMLNNKLKK